MSQGQEYFPPGGTKYKWWPKPLNHSPWGMRMWDYWPASIKASVNKEEDGTFHWRVEVTDFRHRRTHLTGKESEALSACLAAEKACEEQKALLWLPWMEEAVAAGWRPPA